MAEPAEARAPVPRLLAALEAAGSSRAARLEALAGLRAALAGQEAAAAAAAAGEGLLRPLARCMAGDPAERCREEAVELLGLCLASRPAARPRPSRSLPALARRLRPRRPRACERELRLGLLRLLGLLLRLGPDAPPAPARRPRRPPRRPPGPLPQAQRQAWVPSPPSSSRPSRAFPHAVESLISPLMQAVSHQHFRPLLSSINGRGFSLAAQSLWDDVLSVREAVIIVMGEWLLHLRDRYSFFPKLIPLLLSGLADEMHENRELALSYWKKVGLQWEKENEDDIKDKLDFYSAPSYYPHGEARPGLGCRELVTRHLYKILPGLCRDMTDWVVGTRIKASRLLSILLQHAEDHITQHMELLLRTLYRACSDEEILVSREVSYLEQLLGCVEVSSNGAKEDCKEIGLQLAKILVTVMAIPTAGHLHEQIEEAMKSLAEVQGLAGLGGLYRQHISELMHWVSSAPDTWTCYSSELLQLDVIATHSGPAIGEALEELFLILKTCLQTSKDPLMRLKLFSTFSQLLQEPNKTINSQGQFCNYLEIMIKDILAPNLQWQGGRTAAAIRTTAVSCLWALIYSELLSPEETLNIERSLLPEILATLDEDSKMTRSFSCQIISVFLAANGKQFEPDKLISVYPELLKRLDDASHEVRLEAAKALVNWFRCIDDDKKALLKTNIEFLYRELLVELDDPNQNIQLAVLDILKQGGILYPDLLVEEIKAVLHKHRSPTYLNQLLLHIESTGWSYSKS
uniref:Uncharacterized protein n=1 Tax=Sphaerodactylus townsendi TaxID=933632 RepID=A0ACB8FLK2_9SAUR